MKVKKILLSILALMMVLTSSVLADENETFEVHYQLAVEYAKDGIGSLPSDILDQQPSDTTISSVDDLYLPDLIGNDDFVFDGYNVSIDGNTIYVVGLFKQVNKPTNKKMILKAQAMITNGFGGSWDVKSKGGYTGTHAFIVNGEIVYCIDPHKKAPSVAGQVTFDQGGSPDNRIMEIIYAGKAHGRSDGAIQAAIWNYTSGDPSYAWCLSGENVDPNSSDYKMSGYRFSGTTYLPNSDDSIQRFASVPNGYPNEGILHIKKQVDPNATYNYKDYGYSLANAVYGLYNNPDCSGEPFKTVTTDENGNTPAITFSSDTTVWVKEISAPKGFVIDQTTYNQHIGLGENKTITSFDTPVGLLQIKKQAKISDKYDYLDYSNNYSLQGAQYGIYADQECTDLIDTLITDENGETKAIEFDQDTTVYIKELKPSKGFMVDNRPDLLQPVSVKLGRNRTINSIEQPLNDPINITLVKQNAKDPTRTKYLDTAQFTLKYYDSQSDDLSELTNPLKTWVFGTEYDDDPQSVNYGKAQVYFDKAHFISGDEFVPAVGYNSMLLPIGTFTIEESKAPQTYLKDENIYIGHIRQVENPNDPNDYSRVEITIDGGYWLEVENVSLTQNEREALKTTATFQESALYKQGEDIHTYVADGFAHVLDKVEYDYLKPNTDYVLKAELVELNIDYQDSYYTQEDFDSGLIDDEELIGTIKSTDIANITPLDTVARQEKAFTTPTSAREVAVNCPTAVKLDQEFTLDFTIRNSNKQADTSTLEIYLPQELVITAIKEDGNDFFQERENLQKLKDDPQRNNWLLADRSYAFKQGEDKHFEITLKPTKVGEYTIDSRYPGSKFTHTITVSDQDVISADRIESLDDYSLNEDGSIHGYVDVLFDELDFTLKANSDYVVYEYLYLADDLDNPICIDEDIYNREQSIHIDELYRADFVFYKIGENNKSNKLSGAYFKMDSSRTRRDGQVVENDLGYGLTGGILLYSEKEYPIQDPNKLADQPLTTPDQTQDADTSYAKPFKVKLYKQPEIEILDDGTIVKPTGELISEENFIGEYESKYDKLLNRQAISILSSKQGALKDGIYYTVLEDDPTSEPIKHYVAKGMIFLPLQEEDTKITFKELQSPNGYILDTKPFILDVGHQYSVSRAERYHSNAFRHIPPKTGIE